MQRNFHVLLASLLASSLTYAANTITIPMTIVSGDDNGKAIGTVVAEASLCGVKLTPNLTNLTPGIHGFHIHVKPDCGDSGNAAGGHLDPKNTEHHLGPYAKGHLGDLPVLIVNEDGTATLPTLAPRFSLNELRGHALMVHAGGDNYADTPEKNGGGAARFACGVIK